MFRTTRLATALAAAVLVLAGCGSSDSEPEIASHGAYNDADVAFATQMIPHHAQALAMVDLTHGRPLDPPVQELVQQILDAQTPEIETMAGWLDDWGRKVPATMNDHMHADEGGMAGMDSDSDTPGMMTADEMSGLESASDADFQDMWLEMMIRHHEGAIEMARTESEDGKFPAALDLADSIATSQAKEIDTMKALLAQ